MTTTWGHSRTILLAALIPSLIVGCKHKDKEKSIPQPQAAPVEEKPTSPDQLAAKDTWRKIMKAHPDLKDDDASRLKYLKHELEVELDEASFHRLKYVVACFQNKSLLLPVISSYASDSPPDPDAAEFLFNALCDVSDNLLPMADLAKGIDDSKLRVSMAHSLIYSAFSEPHDRKEIFELIDRLSFNKADRLDYLGAALRCACDGWKPLGGMSEKDPARAEIIEKILARIPPSEYQIKRADIVLLEISKLKADDINHAVERLAADKNYLMKNILADQSIMSRLDEHGALALMAVFPQSQDDTAEYELLLSEIRQRVEMPTLIEGIDQLPQWQQEQALKYYGYRIADESGMQVAYDIALKLNQQQRTFFIEKLNLVSSSKLKSGPSLEEFNKLLKPR